MFTRVTEQITKKDNLHQKRFYFWDSTNEEPTDEVVEIITKKMSFGFDVNVVGVNRTPLYLVIEFDKKLNYSTGLIKTQYGFVELLKKRDIVARETQLREEANQNRERQSKWPSLRK